MVYLKPYEYFCPSGWAVYEGEMDEHLGVVVSSHRLTKVLLICLPPHSTTTLPLIESLTPPLSHPHPPLHSQGQRSGDLLIRR